MYGVTVKEFFFINLQVSTPHIEHGSITNTVFNVLPKSADKAGFFKQLC